MTDLLDRPPDPGAALPPPVAAAPGSALPPPVGPPPIDDRLRQNATALVVSGILTSVLGFAFWVVAARVLSQEDVGTGAALVAAIVLLANVSTLGLRNAFPRFIPIAGPSTHRLVVRGYLLCAAVAALLAALFVIGAEAWSDDLDGLRGAPLAAVGFVAATAAWTIFVLQDSVLTGLRRASWVPLENLAYAVVKIAVLVGLVGAAGVGAWALPIAWAVPACGVLVPLNVLIFTRLMPARAPDGAGPPFAWRSLVRFSAGEYASDVVRNFGAEGVVLVVVAIVGATESAVLFLALTITASIQLVASNIVNAFVAEAAARPADVHSLFGRTAVHAAALVVPAALVGAVLAPVGLAVFGTDYSADGSTVLRLLLLALIPQILISLAIGIARFERRVGVVLAIAIGTSVAPLAGALLLTSTYGIVAVGWSVLVGHVVLAVVVASTVLRGRIVGPATGVLATHAIRVRDAIRHRRRVRAVGSILDELDAVHATGPPLAPRRVIRNTTDVVVVLVDHPTAPRIVKIALSATAAYGLHDHAQAVRTVGASCDGWLASVVPRLLESGRVVGHEYLIETRCPGIAPVVADHTTLAAVAGAVGALHRTTGIATTIGDALLVALVDEPLSVLAADGRLVDERPAIDALRAQLDRSLRGRPVTVSRTHGDTWLGNALVETIAGRVEVTGLVDWEDSRVAGLPEVDVAHLWLSTQEEGLAPATVRLRRRPDAPTIDDLVGEWSGPLLNPALPAGAVVTLAWLAHVSAGLRRASRFALGRRWLDENVRPVLAAVPVDGRASEPAPQPGPLPEQDLAP